MSLLISTCVCLRAYVRVCECVHKQACLCVYFERAEIRDAESLPTMQPARPPFPVSDLELWRMQIWAVAWLRFFKLKCGKKMLLTL